MHAGIRPLRRPDLALVRSTAPAIGAAMFDDEPLQAAPVVVSKQHLALAQPQAVVVNSGIANAATGERASATRTRPRRRPARLLGLAEEVLVLSTGVIGVPLPVDELLAGARGRGRGSRRTAGRGGRGDPDHRHAARRRPPSRTAGSWSAAWRRAPG